MTRTKPPFRADHVGSLLRPAALKEARAQFARFADDHAENDDAHQEPNDEADPVVWGVEEEKEE